MNSTPARPARRGKRVLIVDDEPDSADLYAFILEGADHETRVCYDPGHAIVVASHFYPEVVISDVGLPGMSGFELVRALRQNLGQRRCLYIAVSGYDAPERAERALRHESAGFDLHLTKPVDTSALLLAVAKR